MEEILASIKRVIADDGRAAPVAQRQPRQLDPEPEPIEAEEPEEDVLELDDVMGEDDGLMSEDRAFASRQSLAALAAMRQAGEPMPMPSDQGPLEAVVREMLRPMLKQWLDQRLPDMVEDMVAREIARITGKRL